MSGYDDLFGTIFNTKPKPPRPGDDVRNASAARADCNKYGHRYQVHGKNNPTKVACARCKVSWAIGPRTEPT